MMTRQQDRTIKLAHLRNCVLAVTDTARNTVRRYNVPIDPKTVRHRLRDVGLRPRRPYVESHLTRQRHDSLTDYRCYSLSDTSQCDVGDGCLLNMNHGSRCFAQMIIKSERFSYGVRSDHSEKHDGHSFHGSGAAAPRYSNSASSPIDVAPG